MKLTKDKIIDLLMIGQYLGNSSDFAAYVVMLAQSRYLVDRYDTTFLNVREVLVEICNMIRDSSPSSFDIQRAYYLAKYMEEILQKYGDAIKSHNFIRNSDLRSRLSRVIDAGFIHDSLVVKL
jgi:hypothetical protein